MFGDRVIFVKGISFLHRIAQPPPFPWFLSQRAAHIKFGIVNLVLGFALVSCRHKMLGDRSLMALSMNGLLHVNPLTFH